MPSHLNLAKQGLYTTWPLTIKQQKFRSSACYWFEPCQIPERICSWRWCLLSGWQNKPAFWTRRRTATPCCGWSERRSKGLHIYLSWLLYQDFLPGSQHGLPCIRQTHLIQSRPFTGFNWKQFCIRRLRKLWCAILKRQPHDYTINKPTPPWFKLLVILNSSFCKWYRAKGIIKKSAKDSATNFTLLLVHFISFVRTPHQ